MANAFRDYIKEKNFLTADQYKEVNVASTKNRQSTFYSALLQSGFLPEKTAIKEACAFFGCLEIGNPFRTQIDFDLSFKVISSIDRLKKERVFAVVLGNGKRAFVIPDPENESYKSAITTAAGEDVQYALITKDQFDIFSQYQIKPKENQIRSSEVSETDQTNNRRRSGIGNVEATAAQRLLDSLITCAIERRASDLHIRSMGPNRDAKVLLRVDGVIQEYTEIRSNALENLRNLLKTKCRVGGEQPDVPVEGKIAFNYNGTLVDTRVNIVPAIAGYDFVLRFINSSIRTIPELGLNGRNQALYNRLLNLTKGLVLVCGPTGSGKTSLLYAGLKKKLAENKVIFTMEDPVEITLPGVVQININKEKGMSYLKRFPSSLRHDPDIILFGEIREREVAENAIQASDTGHLVLSTIHANDAASAITRLINIGVEPYALGDVLAGVVAQRLVRKICPDCKEEYDLPEDHAWRELYGLGNGKIRLARGVGCAKCAGTGYFDRTAINEIILVSPKIRDAIQTRAPRSVVEAAMAESGFRSYIQDGIQKALDGITTLDELTDFQNDILKSLTIPTDIRP